MAINSVELASLYQYMKICPNFDELNSAASFTLLSVYYLYNIYSINFVKLIVNICK